MLASSRQQANKSAPTNVASDEPALSKTLSVTCTPFFSMFEKGKSPSIIDWKYGDKVSILYKSVAT